jgi:hypothetical protein
MLPKFLIAGAAKSGSSTLYHYLSIHPDVFMPDIKEPAFFSKYYNKGLEWYESLFAKARPGQITGEATVEYMVDADSPLRIKKDIPNIKLIFILRNPIDRAWSHYWHRVKMGEETRKFEDILHGKAVLEEYIIRYGFYYKCIERYYNLFGADQIKIVILEEAATNFSAVISDIYFFIGITKDDAPANIKLKNKSAMYKYQTIAQISAKIRKIEPLKETLPLFLLQPLRTIFRRINKANLKDWDYPSLNEHHRKELKAIFATDVESLNIYYPGVSKIWDF